MSWKKEFRFFYAISFAWQLGFLIAVPLALFLFLGVTIDRFFKTGPLFLILFLVLAIISTIYEIYHWLLPLMERKNKK